MFFYSINLPGNFVLSEDLDTYTHGCTIGVYLMAEELSLKPMTELLGLAFRVAFTICISVSGAGCPSSTSCAPKNQCRLHA